MVDQDSCSVNTLENLSNEEEEIMVPYDRVLFIAWDRDVGLMLQALRNTKGLSQSELAKLTNGAVSVDTIKSLESGRAEAVSRQKLDALLKGLGRDIRSLFPSVTVRNLVHQR
ncbi:MAG: helix-turn-helix domain-containing protein [Planktothrix sp.]|uniref:helix-turn-helix domain-containing protein n=3 Tax=Planktothrix sp. TaxID=3088171 RepID=UPI0038D45093